MTTASTFTQQVTLFDIPPPAQSVGAHIAAKLQIFQTDERTLTDELCDMLCIWLGIQATKAVVPGPKFTLTLSKTTTADEVKTGADLELIVASPLGAKRCLVQAKVLDPVSMKLRCATKEGWKKLRKQLVAARAEVGPLAFLAVYVPGVPLNGKQYGYSTYEQHGHFTPMGTRDSYWGVTFIPVDDLLGPSGRWRRTKEKVSQPAPARFQYGLPFWRVLLELLTCRRGLWKREAPKVGRHEAPPFRTLSVRAGEIDEDGWLAVQRLGSEILGDEVGNSGQDVA